MIEVTLRQQYATLDLQVDFRADVRTLALFGPSGSGKTTVLNAIAGLLRPQTGRLVLDGRVLFDSRTGLSVDPSQRHIGYVFQDGRLFPHLNVRHNLVYSSRRNRGRGSVAQFAAIVELLDLGALLKRRTQTLSGGEARRVAIGRALLSRPAALLLDEPLVGLHQEARARLMGHLQGMRRELNLPTVLVSHAQEEIIALADQVITLRSGATLAQDSLAQFAAKMGPTAKNTVD